MKTSNQLKFTSPFTASNKESTYGIVLQLSFICSNVDEAYTKHNETLSWFRAVKPGYTGCFIGHKLELWNEESNYFKSSLDEIIPFKDLTELKRRFATTISINRRWP